MYCNSVKMSLKRDFVFTITIGECRINRDHTIWISPWKLKLKVWENEMNNHARQQNLLQRKQNSKTNHKIFEISTIFFLCFGSAMIENSNIRIQRSSLSIINSMKKRCPNNLWSFEDINPLHRNLYVSAWLNCTRMYCFFY